MYAKILKRMAPLKRAVFLSPRSIFSPLDSLNFGKCYGPEKLRGPS